MKLIRYTDKEKASLVNRLLTGESLNTLSQEAGVNAVPLSRWRKEYRESSRFLTCHQSGKEL